MLQICYKMRVDPHISYASSYESCSDFKKMRYIWRTYSQNLFHHITKILGDASHER